VAICVFVDERDTKFPFMALVAEASHVGVKAGEPAPVEVMAVEMTKEHALVAVVAVLG
jgi:hypothetical protein